MMSSPTTSSDFDSSPLKPDESNCHAWYAFKTADLREIEKKKGSGYPHGGLRQVLRTYNVTVSRQPDLSNLARSQQYLQLAAIKAQYIEAAIRTLAELGAPGIKAPEPTSCSDALSSTALQKNHQNPNQDITIGHPRWTSSRVAIAEFVPQTQKKPGTVTDTPTPQSRAAGHISPSGSTLTPLSKKLPPHLRARDQGIVMSQQLIKANDMVTDPRDDDHIMTNLNLQLDHRLRANTIEYDPSFKASLDSGMDKRPERSSSSPPKFSYSQLARSPSVSKIQWNSSWYGSARTASGESTDKDTAPVPPVRKPVKLTKPDGTPILPSVYKVPQRRSEETVSHKSTTKAEHIAPENLGTMTAESKTTATSNTASAAYGHDERTTVPPVASLPTHRNNMYTGDPQETDLLIRLLKDEMGRNQNIEVPLRPQRTKAPLPSYPAGAPIPGLPRTQPYTNVIPRIDQVNQLSHYRAHIQLPFPKHYPADLIDLNPRGNGPPYPMLYEPMDYSHHFNALTYDQNVHPRSPTHKVFQRVSQYEPRYGTVRNGRDVRTGYGMPRGHSTHNHLTAEEEPEDYELEIMNNIPYRLRPIPLTGPRFIR